jgi:hypothetical protein
MKNQESLAYDQNTQATLLMTQALVHLNFPESDVPRRFNYFFASTLV